MGRVLEGRNSASPDEAASFVSEVDRLEQQREVKLAELDAEFKKKKRDLNKEINAEQKAIYDDAKKVGVKKGVIKTIVVSQKRIRKHSEALEAAKDKAAESLEQLEDDDEAFAVDIVTALGEDFAGFGLGAAAVEREEAVQGDITEPVIEAVKQSASEDEWEEAGRIAAAAAAE